MKHLVLVDGNSMGFAAMGGGPKLVSGDKQTGGTFYFLKRMHWIFSEYKDAFVLVLWDGRSWRKDLTADYKAKRDAQPALIEMKKEYYDQKPDMQKLLRLLGIAQAFADNMEADDLAEIYSRQWQGDKVTLITGDQDWLQLVDDRTTWHDPIRHNKVDKSNFSNFTGFKNRFEFVEAKSVLGDKDEVPGIKGIGPKILEVIYKEFKMTFREFLDYHLSFPVESNEEWKRITGKKLPKIITTVATPETFVTLADNDKLGDLRTVHRPEPINLKRTRTKLNVAKFEDFCYSLAFMSVTVRLNTFLKPFMENTYIDIE